MTDLKKINQDEFFLEFAKRFRGSEDLIKERLHVYFDILEEHFDSLAEIKFLDLGCGSGEWLALLSDRDFSGLGIENNAKLVEKNLHKGYPVINADVLKFLENSEDESYEVITAFHVVEHLSFEMQISLITEAKRVLTKNGVLILETPNPGNLSVAGEGFWTDPTHLKPIPSELLKFICQEIGFMDVRLAFLQESRELACSPNASLLQTLKGASPDYAVICSSDKYFNEKLCSKLPKGLTLEELTFRYENNLNEQLQTLVNKYDEVERRLAVLETSKIWRVYCYMSRLKNFYNKRS